MKWKKNGYLLFGSVFLGLFALSQSQSAKGLVVRFSENWQKFDALFKKYGAMYNVPFEWLKAIALNESSLGLAPSVARGLMSPRDVQASISSDGKSWGLMQVTLTTAKSLDPMATPEKLNNADYSIGLAALYIGTKILPMFSQNDPRFLEWVIKSYNQGPGNTLKEKSGVIKKGYADEYFVRFVRNLNRVMGDI